MYRARVRLLAAVVSPHVALPGPWYRNWYYDDSGDIGLGLLGMVHLYPYRLLNWRLPNVLENTFDG